MPTYQYRCSSCGREIERVQKFSDPALTTCEDCGGPLRKVYNAVGIVFKGSGFYATDNRTKGTSSAAAPAETSSGTTAGGDAKPSSGAAAPTTGTSTTTSGSTPSAS